MNTTISQHSIFKLICKISAEDPYHRVRNTVYWDSSTIDPKAMELPTLVVKYGLLRMDGPVVFASFHILAFDRVVPDRSNVALVHSQLTTLLQDYWNAISNNIEGWAIGILPDGHPVVESMPFEEDSVVKGQALTFTLQLPNTACLSSLGFGELDLSGDGYTGASPTLPEWLSCSSLSGCSVIQGMQSDIAAISGQTSSFDCEDLLGCSVFTTLSAQTESLTWTASAHAASLATVSAQTEANASRFTNYLPLSGGTGGPYILTGQTTAEAVNATAIYSGGTDLSHLLPASTTPTHVQPGLNTTTGGTAFAPIVNVAGAISLTSMTFSSFVRDGSSNTDGGIYYKSPSTTMMTASASYMLDSTTGLVRYLFAGTASGAYTPTGGFTGATLQASTSIKSGTTDLGALFAPISVVSTYLQPGSNITTGGTITRPIVSVAGSPSFTSVTTTSLIGTNVSATTFSSGATELSVALANKFNSTYAPASVQNQWHQNGSNITTGGTANAPSANLNNSIALGSISASTVTASTFYVGSVGQANIRSTKLATTFTTNSATYVDLTGLSFDLEASSSYEFRFLVNVKSANVNAGFGLSLNGPSSPAQFAAVMLGHQAAGSFVRFITAYDDGTGAATSLAANTAYAATMSGVITTTGAGSLQLRMLRGGSNFTLSAMTGSAGILTKLS